MNRDELEAERENTPSVNLMAKDLTPPIPAKQRSNLGAVLDPQSTANLKISLATMNTRTWTAKILDQAFRAARPVAEDYLRSVGKTWSRNDARALTRSYLASYVKTYGVLLPPGTTLGGSPLKSTASDICGPLDVPLMFMPPAISEPIKLAAKAPEHAKSWFAKLFSRGPKAAPEAKPAAAPAATPATAAATAAAPATASAGSIPSRRLLPPAKGTSSTMGAAKAPLKQPANATEQKMLAHIVAQAKKGDPNARAALLRLKQEGFAVTLGHQAANSQEILGGVGAWMYRLNPLYWVKSSEERKLVDKEREGWEKNAELQKQLGKRQEVLDQATKAQQAQAAVQAAQTRSVELETQLKSIETQLAGACACDTSGKDKTTATDALKPNPFEEENDAPDADDAAPVLERIQKARALNANNAVDLSVVAKKMAAGRGLTPAETSSVMQYLARNERLHEFRKGLVSGENYSRNPSKAAIQRQVVLGAMKAMTPSEQQMMSQLIALAKQGNPDAQKALVKLRAQGYAVTMGSNVGWGISDAWHVVTAPIKYGVIKPLDWTAQKLGITSSSSKASPEQIRLQRLQASQKRIQAAQARAAAADAETDAERRVQEQEAAAADAEADAADAAATALQAKQQTAEKQFMVSPQQDDGSDQSGKDSTGKAVITALPPTPTASDQLAAARRKLIAKKNPRAARIWAASDKDDPTGRKLKASMALYSSAKKGNRRDKAAIYSLAHKAKKGDKQARQDMLALKAAQLAMAADARARRSLAITAARRAADKKGIALQRRLEANAAQALTRQTRAHRLAKVARIERKAAAGHKPSQAIINNVVANAKKGDKNALTAAKAFKLAQTARKQTPTRADRKKLAAAHTLVRKVKKGDKRSLAELRVLKSAAAHGNPNAKKAMTNVKLAAATETALATGAIVLPAGVALSIEEKKRKDKKSKRMQKHIASVQSKIAKKTASREEAQKAAGEAAALGDKETSARLAAEAVDLPSAQDNLRRVATVASAAAAGSAVSQEKVAVAQKRAEAGDPAGIAAMGQLAAVKSLDDVRQDRPIEPPMKAAVQDLEKAEEGDEATKAKLAAMQAKAATGDSDAVKYMTYAAGAAVVARSLANNPAAEEEWKQKAGIKPRNTDNEYVDTSRKPVLPSLPPPEVITPLEPIQGFGELVKESLKALLFATRNPVQNHTEAVLSLSKLLPAIDASAGEENKKAKKEREADLSAIDEALAPGLQAAIEARKPKVAMKGMAVQGMTVQGAAPKAPNVPKVPGAPARVLAPPKKEEEEEENDDESGDDQQAALIASTRARLSKVKTAANKGDANAIKQWQTAQANYQKHKAAAAKGDARAKNLVTILDATGLFAK